MERGFTDITALYALSPCPKAYKSFCEFTTMPRLHKYIFAVSNWVREVETVMGEITSILRDNGYPVKELETETIGFDDDRIKFSYETAKPLKEAVIEELKGIQGVSLE
jgi:hypothetical protein